MTLTDFVNKYNGVHIDEDGYYGAQCWDVSARYAREVVGCPSFPTGSGGAEGLFRIFANPIPQYFDKIANNKSDPNQLPAPGDVIVWDASFSPPWGHTAVCISADASGVNVIEQNGNNPGGAAYIKKRGWTGVSGWLRPKNKGDTNVALVGNGENWYARLNQLHIQTLGRPLGRDTFNNLIGWDTLKVIELFSDHPEAVVAQHAQEVGQVAVRDNWEGQINTLRSQVAERDKQTADLQTQTGVLSKQIEDIKQQLDELVKTSQLKDKEIADLKSKLATQGEDTVQLNKIGEILRWAVKRFGTSK